MWMDSDLTRWALLMSKLWKKPRRKFIKSIHQPFYMEKVGEMLWQEIFGWRLTRRSFTHRYPGWFKLPLRERRLVRLTMIYEMASEEVSLMYLKRGLCWIHSRVSKIFNGELSAVFSIQTKSFGCWMTRNSRSIMQPVTT